MWIDPPLWDWEPNGEARRRRVFPWLLDGYVGPSRDHRQWSAGARAAQRAQIERCIRARGWRVGRIVEEPGSAEGRPELAQALERIEAGESAGIVISRLEHLGCSLVEVLAAIERIQAAGGLFISVCDGIELGTSAGRRFVRLLFAIAEWRRPKEAVARVISNRAERVRHLSAECSTNDFRPDRSIPQRRKGQ